MNTRDSWLLVVAILTVGLLGCEKKAEPPSAPPTNSPTGSVGEAFKSVADTASNELKKVVEEVKTTAGKTLTEVTQQAQNLTSGATAQAQEYIDKARAFVSQQKYQDALAALKGLGNVSLSPEQQKAVDDLKQAIQKALGSGAVTNPANAATNLPGN
jgi:hypothetical protein